MDNISVSVIIPVYNCERYIGKAIESVLAQKVDLECIIVDDNSTDKTSSIVKSYMDDARIKYVKNETNKGVAYNRNLGVKMARGKYVAFLDADDYWTEDKLSVQLSFMEENGAVLTSTGRELMDEDGNLSGKCINIPEKITYKRLLTGNVINTSASMVLTEVARKYPMVNDRLHEDYIMWLSILKDGNVAYGINEPMLKYRMVKGSKSNNKFKSARMTYGVYRYIGLSPVKAFYYFCCYAVKGVLKYI
ncbi:MAG: glycosyltransferase [Lachnospiraceae bacterium]|nr:glycosyltransferase [Lachnospiraceae bacterium]